MKRKPALGLQQTLMLEISMVLGIILILLTTLLPNVNPIIAKTRLVEMFYITGNNRIELMERMALSGEGITDQALPSHLQARDIAQENIEDYLGRKQTASDRRPDAESVPSQQASAADKARVKRLGQLDIRANNYSLIVSGVIGAEARPFYVTFNPSVVADGPATNMIWLCGSKRPLPGWTPPLERAGTDLPTKYISFICR